MWAVVKASVQLLVVIIPLIVYIVRTLHTRRTVKTELANRKLLW